jgi:hypothetical protein
MSASLRNSGRSGRGIFQVHNNADTATAGPLVMKLQKRGQSRADLARSLRSLFEALEDRTLFSTLPAPVLTSLTTLVTDNSVTPTQNYTSPTLAYDPQSTSDLFTAFAAKNGTEIDYMYSIDGGIGWSVPTAMPKPFVQAADPSVAFDGSHHVYLVYAESTASNGTGAAGQGQIVLQKFAFAAGGAPVLDATIHDKAVYSWNGSGAGGTPVVAADANPANANGIADTNTGNVYIAWSQASDGVANLGTTSDIELTSSTNGGTGFTTATKLNTAASRTAERQPQMVVSQGVAGAAGQVEVAWVDAPAPAPGATATAAIISNTFVPGGAATLDKNVTTGLKVAAGFSAWPEGAETAISIAADNTVGTGSPNAGALYVAFSSSNQKDISLAKSTNGGSSWLQIVKVSDDNSLTDGFSDPNRLQYEPEVAVDEKTGTIAVQYYDTRYDALGTRVATTIATSIDGGLTFSAQLNSTLSTPLNVTDAITGKTVEVGPFLSDPFGTPDNFGSRQSLMVVAGKIVSVYTGNTGFGATTQSVEAARATIAAGPRVVSGTSGLVASQTVTIAGSPVTINNALAADGTPILNGFVITLDRPVDPASFTAADIDIYFRKATTQGTASADLHINSVSDSTLTVTPVDSTNAAGRTQFLVRFAGLSHVGTYTYSVSEAHLHDDVISTLNGGSTQNGGDQNSNATVNETPAGTQGDRFAQPQPTASNAAFSAANGFAPLFNSTSLPLMIAGPHVVSIVINGSTHTNVSGTLLNDSVLSFDVKFDRNMDPTSIFNAGTGLVNSGVVQQVVTPTGVFGGTFTVTSNPSHTDPDPAHPQTYRFTFVMISGGVPVAAPQSASGTYTVALSSTIKTPANADYAGGIQLDTNQNAGLDKLRATSTLSAPANPVATTVTNPVLTPDVNNAHTATAQILVPQSFIVQMGSSFKLDLTYPNDPDLSAYLISPDGTVTIQLFSGVGNSATPANFTNTTFSDSATTSILSGFAPFNGGIFSPQADANFPATFTTLGTSSINSTSNGVGGTAPWILKIVNSAGPATAVRLNSVTLTLNAPNTTTGLGEPAADVASLSFRVFNLTPSNAAAANAWTAVGPASYNGGALAGRVSAIAVDPADPSGNTVYVGAATGGVWKTTNFLTSDPNGPTYIPLTDFGPSAGINIGSIAVYNSGSDTTKSVIVVGTGEADTDSAGVGFLISKDGGMTWTVLDSLNNNLPDSSRSLDFLGLDSYKVVFDPNPTSTGGLIIYAAMGDTTAGGTRGGLYRSFDTGQTWSKLNVAGTGVNGDATDVVLDLNSTAKSVSNPTGNAQFLYAAIAGQGVYFSQNKGNTFSKVSGGIGDPLIQVSGSPVPVSAPASNPNGAQGRVLLAKPALTGIAAQDKLYQGWLYALVISPVVGSVYSGSVVGLYVTKDFGQNWTQVRFPSTSAVTASPTNDITQNDFDLFMNQANYDATIAVDPTNPSVVYIGGANGDSTTSVSGFIRVDITGLADPHAFFRTDDRNSSSTPVAIGGLSTVGTININSSPYINLIQDPTNPFGTNSTIKVSGITSFSNDGSGAKWTPFDIVTGLNSQADVHRVITLVDPLTGKARLIFGDDSGVFTAVDDGTGQLLTSDGSQTIASGSRNGNLQIAQLLTGTTQPNSLTAQISSLIYATSSLSQNDVQGYGNSAGNILTTGNLSWNITPTILSGPNQGVAGVETDQQGSTASNPNGTVYRFEYPGGTISGISTVKFATNFFQVNGISRTNGLIQTSGGGAAIDPQWTDTGGSVFAVNPINGNEIIMGSQAGRLFATNNQGAFWSPIGQPTVGPTTGDFDGSVLSAMAFGAPDPGNPLNPGGTDTNFFMYVGSTNGHVYVTTTGGGVGNWTNISTGLDGSQILQIIPSPLRGSHKVFVVTQKAVYELTNSVLPSGQPDGNATWVDVSDNLDTNGAVVSSKIFSLGNSAFGKNTLNAVTATALTAAVADWRYALPDDPTNPNGSTHPVLYVAADVGIYRSTDDGATWTLFPDVADDGAGQDGGYLPNVKVTSLSLSLGAVDPNTGFSVLSSSDPDLLVATTQGRGAFAIALAPVVSKTDLSLTTLSPITQAERTNSTTPVITGYSEISTSANHTRITLLDVTNPNNPIFLGGFNPADPIGGTSDTPANHFWTTTSGAFNVRITTPLVGDGVHTIAIEATDDAHATGPMQKFNIVLDQTPPAVTPFPSLSGSEGTELANVAVATFTDINTNPDGTTSDDVDSNGNPIGAASINWGDGTSSAGTISYDSTTSTFTVTGTHTYLLEGAYNASVTVADELGNSTTAAATIPVTVSDPSVILTPGSIFTSTEGVAINNQLVATFTDPGTNLPPGSYTAIIDWGDGTAPTQGTVIDNNGTYEIRDSHTYAAENLAGYSLTITVNHGAAIGSQVMLSGIVISPSINATGGFTLSALEQQSPAAQTVATFTDSRDNDPADAFTALIDWGDGSSTPGTVTLDSGVYSVLGTHQYVLVGTYPITVTIDHANSTEQIVMGTAAVADVAVDAAGSATAFTGTEGTTTGPTIVATFTDPSGPNYGANHYEASIDWGDGTITPGTIDLIDPIAGVYSVSGSHEYALDGNYTILSTITQAGIVPATATTSADISDAPIDLVQDGFVINASRGITSTAQTLAIFSDEAGNGIEPLSNYAASIDWGDGTTSDGTISFDSIDNEYVVTGQHAYATSGPFTVVTTFMDAGGSTATATSAADVIDLPVIASSPVANLTGTENVDTALQAVATFTDPGGPESLDHYSADIDWGDGTISPGTISFDAGTNTFTVMGTHKYFQFGSISVVTTIHHDAAEDATATATAVIADAKIVPTGGLTFNATENTLAAPQVVATFIDLGGNNIYSIDSYTATINWGDGTSSPGAIAYDPMNDDYTVTAGHQYVNDGTDTIKVTLKKDALPNVTAISTATVAEIPISATGAASPLPATEGTTSGTLTVATFTDPPGAEGTSNYVATINWGDGTSSSGTITFDSTTQIFSVNGTHKYTLDGDYTVVTTINHHGSLSTATSTAHVLDVSVTPTGGFSFTATEGTLSSSQTVATFIDPPGPQPLSDYAATIDWGDGTTSVGTITFNSTSNVFTVAGTHIYHIDDPASIITTIHHGTAADVSTISTATVADVPVVAQGGFRFSASEGSTSATQIVATFTDPGGAGFNPLSDYGATIDWGDGTTSAGVISLDHNNGNYLVAANHKYATAATYPIVTTITHESTTPQTVTSTAVVADVPLVASGSFTFNAVEGAGSATQTVATFTDPGGALSLDHYAATINWGDGTQSAGAISFNSSNSVFAVAGSHTYVEEGAYDVTVTITHDTAANSVVHSTAFVSDPPVALSTIPNITAVEGATTGTLTIGTFTDPGGVEAATNYTATIDWGDGSTPTQGQVTYSAATNTFSVLASHIYKEAGSYSATTTISHGAATPSVSSTQATISDASIEVDGVPVTVSEGSTFSGTVGVFTDANPFGAINDYTTSITWGDGTSSPGSLIADSSVPGRFRVVGTHFFANGPTVLFDQVNVVDKDSPNAVSSGNSTVTVNNTPPVPTLTGPAIRFGGSTTFTIGATDASAADIAAGFAYTLNFGDGSAPLIINQSAGNGAPQTITHTFPSNDTFTVTLTATDQDGASASTTLISQSAVPAGSTTPSSLSLLINGGLSNESNVSTLAFTVTSSGIPVTSLNLSNLTLLRNGNVSVPLNNALVSFDPVSGRATLNLHGVNLPDGNYQLQVRMGNGGVLPINFTKLRGDINGDGVVNAADVNAVKNHLGKTNPAFDVNGDGRVTQADLTVVKGAVGHRVASIAKPITLKTGKTITAPKLDFGKVKLGSSPAPIDVVIRNTGTGPLVLLQNLALNNNPGVLDFEIVGAAWGQKAAQFPLAAGKSITVRIFLNPTVSGNVNSTLHFVFSPGTRSLLTAVNLPITAKIS